MKLITRLANLFYFNRKRRFIKATKFTNTELSKVLKASMNKKNESHWEGLARIISIFENQKVYNIDVITKFNKRADDIVVPNLLSFGRFGVTRNYGCQNIDVIFENFINLKEEQNRRNRGLPRLTLTIQLKKVDLLGQHVCNDGSVYYEIAAVYQK